MGTSKPLSPADQAEVERLISGGDPEWVEDDPADYEAPPPLTGKDAAEADRLAKLAKTIK